MDFYILLAALPLFFLLIFRTFKPKRRLPPGPRPLPIIGNLHQMETKNPHHFFHNLSQKYGPIMSLKIGSRPIVIISSAELAKEVLKVQDLNFCTRPVLKGQHKLSYNGIDLAFAEYSPYWREMRKVCMVNLFSPSQVQSFRPIREDEVSRLIEKISIASSTKDVIDLSELMLSLTNSAVCVQAFGKRYAEYGNEMRRFIAILYESQALFGVMFFADYFPYMSWIDRFAGLNSRLDKAFRELDDFLQGIVDERLASNAKVKPERQCLIDILLDLCKTNSFSMGFTNENVKAVTMNIIVAGTDTAAAAVVWAMTYLMKYPKVMKKVQEEVRSLVKDKGYVSEDDIPNLPYMKAVVKEALRLEPIIPLLVHREAIEDCKVGGYDVPAKSIVQVNAWAVSRDTQAWGENPEEFYPERYLTKSVDYKGQDFELIPFGSGRRMCPGVNMGIALLELPFANLLYKFDWELPPDVKAEEINMDVQVGVAMHKKDHLMLIPKKYI